VYYTSSSERERTVSSPPVHFHEVILMKRNAFTLIELLVLVAILAVLAGFLFPLLARAIERGRAVQCRSTLRQIGAALTQYTQDWDDTLPRAVQIPGYNLNKKRSWKDALFPYIGSADLFLCPSNPVGWSSPSTYWGEDAVKGLVGWEKYRLPGDDTQRFPISYCANIFVLRIEEEFTYSADGQTRFVPRGGSVLLSEVEDASSVIAIGETRFRSYWDCGPWFYQSFANGKVGPGVVHHHDKRINYLFLDGSVRGLKAIQTLHPRSLWGSPNLLEAFRGYMFEPPIDPIEPDDPLIQNIGKEYR
jgi:prepilin-type processing-associated H-X9-DG protein/prepilin-type N-terminal cleavage/methylation domain-containing protein